MLRRIGMPSTYIVTPPVSGSLTRARWYQSSPVISPDQAVRSPVVGSFGTTVHWNSRRFENPIDAGESV
jgi:hypothetical protein